MFKKKTKNKNKPSPFWYLLKGIKKPHFLNGLLLLQIYVKLGIDFFNFLSPPPPTKGEDQKQVGPTR